MSERKGWVVIGTGETSSGERWRLRIRIESPTQIGVSLETAEDPARFELFDRMGVGGDGYAGPPLPPDRLIQLRSISRGETEQRIIGEVAPVAERVRVGLDDGRELHAEIIRTDLVESDYFLAFGHGDSEVTAVTALGAEGQALAEQPRSEEGIRAFQAFQHKLRLSREST